MWARDRAGNVFVFCSPCAILSVSMTTQDQDAIAGRLIREIKEKEREIAALRAEMHRIGQSLEQLGGELIDDPEHVVFELQAADMRYVIPGKPAFQPADLSCHNLEHLTNDLRKALEELKQKKEHAGQMGIE